MTADRKKASTLSGVILLVSVFGFLAVASSLHKSPTYDEIPHLIFGFRLLDGSAGHASMQKMPITALHALPVALLNGAGVSLSRLQGVFIARLVTVCLSILLALVIFSWSRELYGKKGGLFSLFLYAAGPNVIAHSRLASNDIACSLFMFAAAYGAVRFFRDPSRGRFLGWAVLTGLAQVSKQTALLLIPIFVIFTVVVRYGPLRRDLPEDHPVRRASPARMIRDAAVFAGLVLVVINLAYGFNGSFAPAGEYVAFDRQLRETVGSPERMTGSFPAEGAPSLLHTLPVPFPRAYVEAFLIGTFYNETGRGHGPIYLLGRIDPMGFKAYFPLIVLFKVPLALLLFYGVRLARIGSSFRLRPLDESMLLFCPLVILSFFTFSCTAQIGIRYLLPMAPFLLVLAGKLWPDALTAKKAYRYLFFFCCAWYLASSLSFFPHYLSYVNELIPDRKMIYRYLADSNVDWGQNRYYLADYLARHQDGSIRVNPSVPVGGRVIVNINRLVGVDVPAARYAWLRKSFTPVDHIAYSWLVFDVPDPVPPPAPSGRSDK